MVFLYIILSKRSFLYREDLHKIFSVYKKTFGGTSLYRRRPLEGLLRMEEDIRRDSPYGRRPSEVLLCLEEDLSKCLLCIESSSFYRRSSSDGLFSIKEDLQKGKTGLFTTGLKI